MRRLTILSVAVLAVSVAGLGALSAPVAQAAQAPIVADCNSHGHLTRTYTVTELRGALSTMSADVKEYTNCYDVIQRALLAQLGGSHQSGSGSDSGSGGSFLPTWLIVVLVLFALGAIGLGAVAVRRRGAASPEGPAGPSGGPQA